MDARAIVPQPDQDKPLTGNDNQMKKGVAEGKNCRPLGDITNLLTIEEDAEHETPRPKKRRIDIDAADVGNELAAVEYVDGLYMFYKLAEGDTHVHDCMDSSSEINEKRRACLVDWLIAVHQAFTLEPEILYLTINIIDRVVSVTTVSITELQLVGICALLLASKYERTSAPLVKDLVYITDGAYTHEEVLMMEKAILGKLEWTLSVPTPYVFLIRFIKASIPDKLIENMANFVAELGLMYHASVLYRPSILAASAVYVARCILHRRPVWNETLRFYTGYSEAQLLDCAKLLAAYHSFAVRGKYMAAYKKYSMPERCCVALIPPAKSLSAAA